MNATPYRVLCVLENAGAGCGRHVVDLCAGLRARGHDVTVLYSHSRLENWFERELGAIGGVAWATVPMRDGLGPGDVASIRAVRRFVRERGPFDVIHGHSSKGGALVRLAARAADGVRVYTPHALYTLGCADRPVRRAVFGGLERILARRCEGIVCVSVDEKRHALEQGLPADKLFIVQNGLAELPDVDRAEVRSELGLDDDHVAFGFVGRLARQKAVHRLVNAFARMAKDHPGARLVVVGDGPDAPDLRARASSLGVGDEVLFTGMAVGQRMMAGFDAFALTSLYEAFPYVLLEAAARSLPIVSMRVGGVDELVHDGDNGCVVEQDDEPGFAAAMADLAADAERRRAMGARSAQIVRAYDVDAMVDKTVEAYATLLARRAS